MSNNKNIKLIAGLGNPGIQYTNTRHNVGFWLINALAKKYNINFKAENKFKGHVANTNIANFECKLLMPTTFMNLSGEAVSKFANFYKILPEEILVIHDELDFAPGIARLKQGGGANGHNGIQNISDQLGSKNFWRLRLGIGRPEFKDQMTSYVLGSPIESERKNTHTAIDKAILIIPDLLAGNFAKATQELHS